MYTTIWLVLCVLICAFIQHSDAISYKKNNSMWNRLRAKLQLRPQRTDQPDHNMTVPEMILVRGFQLKTHYVTTEDCHIITLFQIVNPLVNETIGPVLMQHGLFGSSADFVINSYTGFLDESIPDNHNNLAFYLAKNRYDVWLSNSRGSTYSLNHTTYDPTKDKEYWKFTWSDMATYDTPAIVAYIQNYTQRKKVDYVGHSQGTLTMFALLSDQPNFGENLDNFVALAPVAYLEHTRTPLHLLGYNKLLLEYFVRRGGKFLPSSQLIHYFADTMCSAELRFICENLLFLFNGYDCKQLNKTRLPVYLEHDPAGTSSWNVVHFGQLVSAKKLQKFDYFNKQANLKCYNSVNPPQYNISAITFEKISLFYSDNDWLADPDDVQTLVSKLNVKFNAHKMPLPEWNHLDFVLAETAGQYVNEPVLSVLNASKQGSLSNRLDDSLKISNKLYDADTCNPHKCFM